jgi:hypothetical protein
MNKNDALMLVSREFEKSMSKFPLFNSAHEGYAVIYEELDELWDEIKSNKKKGSMERQRDEAIQVAAMAIKFLVSCSNI